MLPQLGLIIGDIFAVIGSLILYTGAFVAEIARGAVLSIPKHQVDSAKGLGMNKFNTLRLVIIPQAMKMSVPPLLNNSVMMIKATAYVSVVGVWELTYAAREVVERTLAAIKRKTSKDAPLRSITIFPLRVSSIIPIAETSDVSFINITN